jgi:hypothetical protein
MAIQKELWLPRIEENLFQKYELLSTFASDDSIYANNKTIHLPSAGTTPSITKGNGVYPVAIGERTDQEVTYNLTNYEIGPIRLGWADQLQLSYDKSQSITNDFMGGLGDRVIREMLVSFYHRTAGTYVETTGATATAHSPSATSNRHALTGANVLSAALILDKQQIPMSDRFLLLDATMFYQLLTDMNYTAERVEVNPNGLSILIPPIYGFRVVQLPHVGHIVAATGAIRPVGHVGATTDEAVGLAIHKQAVSFAKTGVEGFVQQNSPEYFADLLSASVWAGGSYRRYDKYGVVPIIGDTI